MIDEVFRVNINLRQEKQRIAEEKLAKIMAEKSNPARRNPFGKEFDLTNVAFTSEGRLMLKRP